MHASAIINLAPARFASCTRIEPTPPAGIDEHHLAFRGRLSGEIKSGETLYQHRSRPIAGVGSGDEIRVDTACRRAVHASANAFDQTGGLEPGTDGRGGVIA